MTATTTTTTDRKGIGGPKTEEGRRRVSQNALKHGFYAKSKEAMDAIAGLIGYSYIDILQGMCEHYRPKDALENLLIRRIARCYWRTMLTEALETRHLVRPSGAVYIGKHFETIIRNERLIDIYRVPAQVRPGTDFPDDQDQCYRVRPRTPGSSGDPL